MREPLPLATIHDAVLEFLRGRNDVVLFGAHAVNAYVDEARMSQDVDLLSTEPQKFAEEIREYLATRFHIAVRVREIESGLAYRLYQLQKPKNRHLVDVRLAKQLPAVQRVAGVPVIAPLDLIASKVAAYQRRRGRAKSYTDRRDLVFLLLKFPEFKTYPGPVGERLKASQADENVLAAWKDIVAEQIQPEGDEDLTF